MTELLYLRDAYLTDFEAAVTAVDGQRVALDRTAFYPTGGGQPHDVGTLAGSEVKEVRKEGAEVWHTLDGAVPAAGDVVQGSVDWERRHRLMRTHTAMHVLCGVIWNEWRVPVTGGNMEPLSARMDFEFDPLPDGFAATVEDLVNRELRADRPIEVRFLPRDTALADEDLIRTKVGDRYVLETMRARGGVWAVLAMLAWGRRWSRRKSVDAHAREVRRTRPERRERPQST